MTVSLSGNSITSFSHQHNVNRDTAVSVRESSSSCVLLFYVCQLLRSFKFELSKLREFISIKPAGNKADPFLYSAEKVLEYFSEGRVLIRYRSDSKEIRGGYAPRPWPQLRSLTHLNCLDHSTHGHAWSAAWEFNQGAYSGLDHSWPDNTLPSMWPKNYASTADILKHPIILDCRGLEAEHTAFVKE